MLPNSVAIFLEKHSQIAIIILLQLRSDALQNRCSKFKIVQYSQENICVGESLFNKVAGLKVSNFVKKKLQHRFIPVNIAKFLTTAFS